MLLQTWKEKQQQTNVFEGMNTLAVIIKQVKSLPQLMT